MADELRLLLDVAVLFGQWSDFFYATAISFESEQSLKGVFGYYEKMPHLRRQRSVDQDKLGTHTRPWVSMKIRDRSHMRDIGSRP